ncbi:hypothetical protein [Kitasatospora sp. DSM 101779]|uniref:hypothetical protein n=1 Tax=Kitasatospora sp. DSM 101779 TaxID=2853165 RepID=UPI0021DB042B|nr:hypothetical protein [Kitasatospora sp. DSM 101779]MCU7820137.1 hypothetical protein [Kitasatospora sp. DSM 101779]
MSVLADRVNVSAEVAAIPLRATAANLGGSEVPALCTPAVLGIAVTAAAFGAGFMVGYAGGTRPN